MIKSDTKAKRTAIKDRPAKLIPPEPGRYFLRQPLRERLSSYLRAPGKIWVSSPGGAGKTALVRNLLVDDPRPLIWYQVDHEDRDPANLFYYLSLAVSEGVPDSHSLPQLSPEYLPNLNVFCRNFCKALIGKIDKPFVLVFDDLQESQGESLFGPFLNAVMTELPQDCSLLIISREEPYRQFARQRINRSLAHLCWEDLRLDANESRDFLNWSEQKVVNAQCTEEAYNLTQGWLAGLLLYLDGQGNREKPEQNLLGQTDLLFDYFADEIFSRTTAQDCDFLLLCSLLPRIDVELAKRVTGRSDAAGILEGLVRKNHFTYRIASTPESYRFHPLFQGFLQSKADQLLGCAACTQQRKRAADLLIEAGYMELAAELLVAARAWDSLVDIIAGHAETLLSQGRTKTLLGWLAALPKRIVEQHPWLCYWSGVSLLADHPPQALEALTRAFELFDADGDLAGSMISWAMVVNAVVIAWDDHKVLDEWIERFDRMMAVNSEFPTVEIECLMVQGICKSLAWRSPERADLPAWAERLHRLVVESNDSDFRLLAGSNLVLYHLVSGVIAKAKSLVEVLNSDLQSTRVSPLKKLVWLATRGALEWVLLDQQSCLKTMQEGQSIIEESGIHVLDIRLYGQGVAWGLTTGDRQLARRLLGEMPARPIVTTLDHAYHNLLQADLSLLEGDTAKAIALAETAVKRSSDGGNLVIRSMSLSVFTLALYQDGQLQRAQQVLDEALALTSGMGFFRSALLLQAAYMALQREDQESAHFLLREGFGLAAKQGYLNFLPWRDAMMARLCQEALTQGIEVEYVSRLSEGHKLSKLKFSAQRLSPKEKQTLGWVQVGKTTREIARISGVSEATVKFHVGNVLRKLGASSRTQAVAIALKAGLLEE
ncbi:MAG: LuxR C-terminal-related transcriptional regulator [Candidatus Thiodiazotropha sp.]